MLSFLLKMVIICAMMLQCAQIFGQEGRGDLRFVWYNVENFFDPFDDSLTRDEEFLPGSPRHWTWERFKRKTGNISRVIAATGGWKPPEIVGLAEVENNFVLYRLCRESPLLKYNYHWIHEDSPDPRGIDVALMYLPSAFQPLQYSYRRAFEDKGIKTRDILYVKGLVYGRDTLHLILNHWPSRWGGLLETENRRKYAASCCRKLIDSIFAAGGRPNILIAGDFNDEMTDASIWQVMGVQSCYVQEKPPGETPLNSFATSGDSLIYRLDPAGDRLVNGSLKYQGRWFMFDQVFASVELAGLDRPSGSTAGQDSTTGLSVSCEGVRIFRPPFLLERDLQWTGLKPKRTWIGYRYQEGFSDHLPLVVDFFVEKKH